MASAWRSGPCSGVVRRRCGWRRGTACSVAPDLGEMAWQAWVARAGHLAGESGGGGMDGGPMVPGMVGEGGTLVMHVALYNTLLWI
jgi:hypothetical protein